MKSTDINRYPIQEYLAGLNIYPAKDKGYYGMYHSPFREDSNASMKVDYDKNLWIDYGSNEGGTLIDLVMRIERCSNGEAMQKLEQHLLGTNSFSFQGNSILKEKEPETTMQITGIVPINSPALIDYLRERKIDIDIAKQYCKEISYSVNGKSYFAIGFPNDAGGYELRNKYFKGCTSKEPTTIKVGTDNCQVFEGFMDYLTFLTMKNWQHSHSDVIVLNSLTNLPKVINALSEYRSVAAFLDNDTAGKRVTTELKTTCQEVCDLSTFYAGYKDLNDYLCRKHTINLPTKKKSRGLKR